MSDLPPAVRAVLQAADAWAAAEEATAEWQRSVEGLLTHRQIMDSPHLLELCRRTHEAEKTLREAVRAWRQAG